MSAPEQAQAPAAPQTTPEKEYDFMQNEVILLNAMIQANQNALANILAFIAASRLGYHVTPQTQFRVDDTGKKLFISELIPPAAEEVTTATGGGQ